MRYLINIILLCICITTIEACSSGKKNTDWYNIEYDAEGLEKLGFFKEKTPFDNFDSSVMIAYETGVLAKQYSSNDTFVRFYETTTGDSVFKEIHIRSKQIVKGRVVDSLQILQNLRPDVFKVFKKSGRWWLVDKKNNNNLYLVYFQYKRIILEKKSKL